MILIDKTKDVQTIILTLTELSDGVNGDYILNLKSDANRVEYSVILPVNESQFTERFDLFNISTSEFNELIDGLYTYSVALNGKVLEMGKAHVKGGNQSDQVIQANSSTDQIFIYGE